MIQSYLNLLRRGGWIGGLLNGHVSFRGGFWLGRRGSLWYHSSRVAQRVVRIDSSRFSEDFGNEIGLGRLGRQGDRRVLEKLFELDNLEGFSDIFRALGQIIWSLGTTHNLDSILDNVENGSVTTGGGGVTCDWM